MHIIRIYDAITTAENRTWRLIGDNQPPVHLVHVNDFSCEFSKKKLDIDWLAASFRALYVVH